MAITWRNLNSNSTEGVATMLAGAQAGFNKGLESLNSSLQQYQAGEKAAWETTRNNNAEAVLNNLASYQSPEALQADIASGKLQQQILQYGDAIDASKVRNAPLERLAALQQQGLANNEYQDAVTQRQQLPIVDQAGQLIAQGNFQGAEELLNQHVLSGESKLWDRLTGERRAVAGEQRAVNQDSRAQQSHGLSMQNGQVNLQKNRLGLEALQSEQQANYLAGQLQREYLEQVDHVNAGHAAVAQELGLPISRSGQVITQGASAEQLKQFKDRLKEAGVPDLPSTTQFLEHANKQLMASGVTPLAANGALNTLRGVLDTDTLTSKDKAYVEEGIAAVTEHFTSQENKLGSRLGELEKTNSLVRSNSAEPYELQAKIQKAVQSASKNDNERVELSEAVSRVTQQGVEIAPGSFIEIPPSMIEAAINTAANDDEAWFYDSKAGVFNKAIKAMASDPAYSKQWEEYTEWLSLKQQKNELQLQKSAAIRAAEEKRLAEVGGATARTETLQRKLLNQRNP
jgi:hypothetical protein